MRINILKHFTLFFSLMAALAGAAHAETLSVQVPFAFVAAGKSLPAGTYTVDSVASGVLFIHGSTGTDSAAVQAYGSETITRGAKPGLIFTRSSDMPVLSSVNMESGSMFTILSVKRASAAAALRSKGTVVLSHP